MMNATMRSSAAQFLLGVVLGVLGVASPFSRTALAHERVYDVQPGEGKWSVSDPVDKKITSGDEVVVRVRNFNFLQYSLSVDVNEQEVASYQYLEKLWASILTPGAGSLFELLRSTGQMAPTSASDSLFARCRRTYTYAMRLDTRISAARASVNGIDIDDKELSALRSAGDDVKDKRKLLHETYVSLQSEVEKDFSSAFGALRAYVDVAEQAYKTVIPKADLFLELADRSTKAFDKSLGKRDSGKLVRVSVKAFNEAGIDTTLCEFSYLVQSQWPLIVHAGLSGSTLDDVSFEKVQRVSNAGPEDFFQKTSDEDWTADAILMAGWPIYAHVGTPSDDEKNEWGVLISLGTSLSEPGKKILLCPSFYWRRLIGSVGAVMAKKVEGEEESDPSIPPDLFKVITEDLTVDLFFSLTIRLY